MGKPVFPLLRLQLGSIPLWMTRKSKSSVCVWNSNTAPGCVGSLLVLLFNLHVKESCGRSLCSGQKATRWKAFCPGFALNGGWKSSPEPSRTRVACSANFICLSQPSGIFPSLVSLADDFPPPLLLPAHASTTGMSNKPSCVLNAKNVWNLHGQFDVMVKF